MQLQILPFACNCDFLPIDLQGWIVHNINGSFKRTMGGVILEHIGLEKGEDYLQTKTQAQPNATSHTRMELLLPQWRKEYNGRIKIC